MGPVEQHAKLAGKEHDPAARISNREGSARSRLRYRAIFQKFSEHPGDGFMVFDQTAE